MTNRERASRALKEALANPDGVRKLNRDELDELVELPPEIGTLRRLEQLELGSTKLTTLPDAIGRLEKLQALYASGTPLEALPDAIGNCKSLRWLRLANTALTSVPDALVNCTKLEILDLEGASFSAEGGARLRAIVAALKKKKLEVVLWPTFEASEAAKDAPLHPDVLGAVERLGGVLRSALPEDAPAEVSTKAGKSALPPAYRQFMFGVEWPENVVFSADMPDDIDVRDLSLGVWGEVEEYACSAKRPYVCVGDWDGGNYLVVLALDDPNPHDPAVFRLDHDDYDRDAPSATGLQLSEFLGRLKKRRKK